MSAREGELREEAAARLQLEELREEVVAEAAERALPGLPGLPGLLGLLGLPGLVLVQSSFPRPDEGLARAEVAGRPQPGEYEEVTPKA